MGTSSRERSLCLDDLTPGDMLRYINSPRIPSDMVERVLIYLKPYDEKPDRTWEIGVFLSQSGAVRCECTLYLQRV